MLARIQKSIREKDAGFTLIELLVVMIIIGVLAAIAIPVFLSQRAKAQDAATKADVSVLGKELATYYIDGTATPTITIVDSMYNLGSQPIGRVSTNVVGTGSGTPAGIVITKVAGTPAADTLGSSNWCVDLTNPQGSGTTKTWRYSASKGLENKACTTV